MEASATAVNPAASMVVSDATGDLLNVVGLAIAALRSTYRLSRTRAIDVGLPDWSLDAVRANVAMRAGVDLLSVSDADVTNWFVRRGARPQWLADFDPLNDAGGTPVTAWPATVRFMCWIAGAYAAVDAGRIDLGVMRDSTLNATNDFTAAWSEQFTALAQLGPAARVYSVAINVDGVTACCATAAA
jgi:hypothetical protein